MKPKLLFIKIIGLKRSQVVQNLKKTMIKVAWYSKDNVQCVIFKGEFSLKTFPIKAP